jgi:hypothetical protein
MKTNLFAGVLLSVVVITCAVGAWAQSDHAVVANIPFSFSVQQEQFPGGVYEVETLQHGYVRLRSSDSRTMIVHVIPNYSRSNRTAKGKLIFARYGSEYFLKQLWIPSSDFGMDLQGSARQEKLAKEMKGQQVQVGCQGN